MKHKTSSQTKIPEKRFIRFVFSLVLLLLLMAACSPQLRRLGTQQVVVNPRGGIPSVTKTDSAVNIVLVQHALCTWDSYWCVVQKGITDAAKDLQVNVTILAPNQFDLQQVVQLIEQAGESKPDGIGVTVTDAALFKKPLRQIIDAGIPVIAYDSGFGPRVDEIPYITYIGQDGYTAGYLGGLRLAAQGGTRAICINHQVGHKGLDARCQGFIKAMEKSSIEAEVLGISEDTTQSQKILNDYYTTHPDLDIVLTLGPIGAKTFYRFIQTAGATGDIAHGSFDLSAEMMTKIQEGITQFTIDAQPYLQGYMVVQWLTWIHRYGFRPAEEITPTGPSFVDASNVELVQKLTGQYR